MVGELTRLAAGWTGSCGGKKTSSCEKCNQFLNTLAMNDLSVVLFDVGYLVFCGTSDPKAGERG